MSKRKLPWEQLRMFYDPDELMQIPSVDFGSPGNAEHKSGWKQKLIEAKNDGLLRSVEENGILKPVVLELSHRGVTHGNGHHRTASAAHVQNKTKRFQFVPVIFDNNYMGSDETCVTWDLPD